MVLQQMPELLHRLKEPSPFARAYGSLIDMGYRVLPLIPREKRPGVYRGMERGWEGMPGWAEWATRDVEDWRLEQWARMPDANIGLLHTADFIAIDFDSDIAGVHDRIKALLAELPGAVVRRQGKPGTYIQYFRGEGEIDSGVYRMDDGNALEILALGRQSVAAASVHPQGHIYQYITDDTLEDTPREQLPCLTPEVIEQIEAILREAGWDEKAHRESRASGAMGGPVDSSGGIYSLTNQFAMRNLDGWVPALGGKKSRFYHYPPNDPA